MQRLSGGVVALAGLGLVVLWFAHPAESLSPGASSPGQIEQQSLQLDFQRARRDAFACFVATINAELEANKLALDQAAQSVLDYSQNYYPRYLSDLQPVEPGATLHEKVARNLVRHYRFMAKRNPDARWSQLEARLERELDAVIAAAQSAPRHRTGSSAPPRYTNQ